MVIIKEPPASATTSQSVKLANSQREPSASEIETALAENVVRALPTAARALGILYSLLTVAHLLLLAPEHKPILVPLAAVTAVVFFAIFARARSGKIVVESAHAVAGIFGLLGLLNSLLHLAITGDPLQSSNIILVLVGIGAFYLSGAWFWITTAVGFFGWFLIGLNYGMSDMWIHFAIGMAMTVLVAIMIHRIRLRTYSNLHRLRLMQEQQRVELETAHDSLEQRVAERTVELDMLNQTLKAEVKHRSNTEAALLKSEQGLLEQRKTLENLVTQQTAELRQANVSLKETIDSRSRFMKEVGFEIQPLITTLNSKLAVLEMGLMGNLTERQTESIADMQQVGKRLAEAVTNIQTASRSNADQIKQFGASVKVPQMCESVLASAESHAKNKAVSLSLEVAPTVQVVETDSKRIKHVLLKLLSIAIDNTPQNGQSGILVQANPKAKRVEFSVWDTGDGYSAETQRNLFIPSAPNLSDAEKQLATNLMLLDKLISINSGVLSLESLPAGGSVFTVTLPWEPTGVTNSVAPSANGMLLAEPKRYGKPVPTVIKRLVSKAQLKSVNVPA